MRDEWILMEKIVDFLFKSKEIPENKVADFHLLQECLKKLKRVEK